jgi:uncharacterized BrkB/YihY/UPF0761 family membrane protein
VDSRGKYRSVDVAFRFSDRDVATGGAVLAGAVAFRMFLWALPATLVLTGLLGFNADDAEDTATDVGLGKVTAQTVGEAAYQAHRARWVLIIIGIVFLVSVSRTLGVTVRTAVALTWQQPVRRGSPYLQTAGITALVLVCVVLIGVVTSWLRNRTPGVGLVAAVAVVVVWTLGWWAISLLLPHPPRLPWWGLLPGAVLVGVGAEVMHLVILLYLEPRVTSASALYGSFGAAATLLLGAYFIARLVLASAALNATIHARSSQSAQLAELADSRSDPLSASVRQFEQSGDDAS